MIQIGIIEDDRAIRELVGSYLGGDGQFRLVCASPSVEDFLEKVHPETSLDVLLLDIGLPGISGLKGIILLKKIFPRLEVIMFTIHDDSQRIFQAICAGAAGYLRKDISLPRIREGIVNVYEGGSAMSPSIARKVLEHFHPKVSKSQLTPRELQIVQGLVDGLSYKMIADQLQISPNTLNSHIRNIYGKLEVHSKAEVIAMYHKGEL